MTFKIKRIYPALGKVQLAIMRVAEEEIEKTWPWMGIESLTSKVYYPALRGVTMWMGDEYPITRSQRNSVRRAVKSLARRGLVNARLSPITSRKGTLRWELLGIVSKGYVEEIKEKVERIKNKHAQAQS